MKRLGEIQVRVIDGVICIEVQTSEFEFRRHPLTSDEACWMRDDLGRAILEAEMRGVTTDPDHLG